MCWKLWYFYELHDLSNKVYVPNNTEDLNPCFFNMITWINESKTLTRYKSCECKWKFHDSKCNSNQMWNNSKYWYPCKNPKEHHLLKKMEFVIWMEFPATCSCKNSKYLGSFIGYEILRGNYRHDKNCSNKKFFNKSCSNKFLYLLAFLLIFIALLMADSIYCYLIKYWAKKKSCIAISCHKYKFKKIF